MKLNAKRVSKYRMLWVIVSTLITMAGCSTPPSVTPLLRVVERALLEESQRIEDDARRDREQMRGTLDALEDGFNRDLEQTDALSPEWVREATSVYVSARETVVQYQNAQVQDRINRANNLKVAASATRRAVVIVERQDRLLDGVFNEDVQRLISITDWNTQEPGR